MSKPKKLVDATQDKKCLTRTLSLRNLLFQCREFLKQITFDLLKQKKCVPKKQKNEIEHNIPV